MRKYWIRWCLFGGIFFWILVASAEAGTIEVFFRDQNLRYTLFTLDYRQIEYVHLNKVVELFRLTEEIDPIDGRVVLRYGQKSASFFPGQASVIADRRTHFLDVPPRNIEGVIMVPLQFFTAILPLIYENEIAWDAGNRRFVVGVQNLEIWGLYSSPYGEYTRIVVEMNQVVSYKVTEKLPSLLIFELPQSTFQLAQNPLQINSRSVMHVKVIDSFGSTQIIIRLGSEFVRYTHQIMDDPPRLLIDLYNARETLVEAQKPEDIIEENIPTESELSVSKVKRSVLRTVVIDPGHGGSDSGIQVVPGSEEIPRIFEKDLTLKIAKMLETSLTQRLGIRVVLTREGDDFVSSENRATIANSNRADAFVSLHVNNNSSEALSGFEVYTMDYGSLDLPEDYKSMSAQSQSLDYAQAKYVEQSSQLARQIIAAYHDRDNGRRCIIKKAPLFTLKGATMPAIHIEIGYGSNQQDRSLITQEEFQQLLVTAITDGIAAFKKEQE